MFNYNEYKNLIGVVKQHLPIIDFSEVTEKTKKFCVLRHDIEFSIDRAYELAKIEKDLGVISTYTVQLRNNTYNALSEKNIDLIRKIKDLGHNIGLHQNPPLMEPNALGGYILTDIQILEHFYGFEIDRFAFHRPKKEYLASYVTLENKINCYDKKFFHYFDEKPDKLNVLYLSDSNHKWKFGYPLDYDFSEVDKLQLLTHPYSWTESGGDNYGNYLSLIRERNQELLYSMDTETNTFPKELLQ
tara:strand:+ start:551 stop:1282 length:732 start_codon:yes stop_codon:yes gene_type:complete